VSPGEDISLSDSRLKKLERLIRESFRVRDNSTPVYVEVAGNLERVSLRQHQVIFGRRGSGKSCLLVYYRHKVAPSENVHSTYIVADSVKTLDYPDVLLRLLLAIFRGLPKTPLLPRVWKWLTREQDPVGEVVKELEGLLSRPASAKLKVTEDRAAERSSSARLSAQAKGTAASLGSDETRRQVTQEIRESDEEKIRTIENRLADYKTAIQGRLDASSKAFAVFIVDDFYLIERAVQPDVIDYLHRLLRDTDLYLKVGTVRHRTRLLRTSPLHVGVQPQQDIDGFNLDQTLENLDQTGTYLGTMLRELGGLVGIENVLTVMSDEANKDLVLLSGGVPRDYLNIFVGGLERAIAAGPRANASLPPISGELQQPLVTRRSSKISARTRGARSQPLKRFLWISSSFA
jgi:hypothetical protein